MPNSVTKRSSRLAILAVVSVIASLFAFAVPASAAATTADAKATFTACPAGVIPDGGFTDTAGSFADANIDCIKYYGVTTGTTATTYSPAQVVTRAQMALFLTRAAGPSGITVPAATDQGFTDIAGLPQTYQDAINQIKQLGITQGTSATTFSPNDPVSRYQMALFLARWSDAAVEGPGGTEPKDVTPDGNPFTDLGAVSFEAHTAILDLFEMGVTTGTSATAFSPFAAVTREQMAAFITRTMAHTNTRPAGTNIQAVPTSITSGDDVEVAISVRTSAFLPVANALVDVFQAPLASKATAVKADGTCDTAITSATFGGTECVVDAADPDTDSNGNITSTESPTASVIWWAWSGSTGATFDLDTTQVSAAEVTVGAAPAFWLVTDNVSKFASVVDANSTGNLGWEDGGGVKFGTTVTLTFQLVDADLKPVAVAGEKIEIGYGRYVDDSYKGDIVTMLTSDATGTATLSVTETDPSGTGDNAAIMEWYVNTNPSGITVDNDTNALFGDDYVWEDDAAEATTVDASLATVSYTTGTSLVVRGTVYDQYGLAKSGEQVEFTTGVNDDDVAVTRVSNSSGVTSQTISKDADLTSYVETVTAELLTGAGDTDTIDLYFAQTGAADAAVAAESILVADTATNTLVIGPLVDAEFGAGIGGVVLVTYKDNDNFTYDGAPVLVAAFEADVAAGDALTTANYNPAGVSAWVVTP